MKNLLLFLLTLTLFGCDGPNTKPLVKDAEQKKSALQKYVEVPLEKAHDVSKKSSERDAEVAKQAEALNE